MTSDEIRALLENASDDELRAIVATTDTILASRRKDDPTPCARDLADDLVHALERLARSIVDVTEVADRGIAEEVPGFGIVWRPPVGAIGNAPQDEELVNALGVARALLARLGKTAAGRREDSVGR